MNILIFEDLLKKISSKIQSTAKKIGNLNLRGKSEAINLFSLDLL